MENQFKAGDRVVSKTSICGRGGRANVIPNLKGTVVEVQGDPFDDVRVMFDGHDMNHWLKAKDVRPLKQSKSMRKFIPGDVVVSKDGKLSGEVEEVRRNGRSLTVVDKGIDEQGRKFQRRYKTLSDKWSLIKNGDESDSFDQTVRDCPKCGQWTTKIKSFRSIAWPHAKPFYRLFCVCGWFGPARRSKEEVVKRDVPLHPIQENEVHTGDKTPRIAPSNCGNCKYGPGFLVDETVPCAIRNEGKVNSQGWCTKWVPSPKVDLAAKTDKQIAVGDFFVLTDDYDWRPSPNGGYVVLSKGTRVRVVEVSPNPGIFNEAIVWVSVAITASVEIKFPIGIGGLRRNS